MSTEATPNRYDPFNRFFPRQRVGLDGHPLRLPPVEKDELATMIEAFQEKGGEVQRLEPGFADGSIVTS
ncbi:hypothetical protein [Microvirga calopogonii]|uniref:hypothetical protein n=1 Tax=Microvirga calopogonii TaxID=2078013 RepID=UPI000E0E043F|nr:hypothetical protein [Microvirga calopogonii]